LEEVAIQTLHHLFVLEALKGFLEKGKELGSRRRLMVFRSALPPAFNHDKVGGEEALGGLSMKVGVRPLDVECEGAMASSDLCLLKTRPDPVSSPSEPVSTTTPFRLLIGVGSVESVAEVVVGGAFC